jgi:hypothetical protein
MPILKYGAYAHGQNEVAVTITKTALKTEGGVYYADEVTWALTAFPGLQATTQAGVTGAINTLQNAYSVDGYDLVLYLDDGATPTSHALYSTQCNGGTRVIQPPHFPEGKGAEYSTYRSYSIVVAGEVPVKVGVNVLTKFHEQITVEGTGGPLNRFIAVAQGAYVQQTVSQQSTFRVVQSGQAESLYAPAPAPPAPIWPDAEHQELRRVTYESPRMRNGRYYNFGVSWSYTFESNGSLGGQPNQYPQ